MADVPLYNPAGTVAPTPLPGPRLGGTTPEEFGYSAAKQQEAAAGQVEQAAREQVMLQNQVRVNDAINQVRQRALDLTYDPQDGYSNLTGRNALDRPSGKPLTDEYAEKLNETISDVSASLTPQQQRVFNMQAGQVATAFRGDVMRHAATQAKAYALDTAAGTLKNAESHATVDYTNGDLINGGVDPDTGVHTGGLVQEARAAVYAASKVNGDSAATTQANMDIAESRIHRSVVHAALENQDPLFAKAYFDKYRGRLTDDDALTLMGQVNVAGVAAISQAADKAARTTVLDPVMTPQPSADLWSLVKGQESGGRRFGSDGKLLQGPALPDGTHAQGDAQVRPTTADDPGLRVMPARKLADGSYDPADLERMGHDYFKALMKRYDNNPTMALAAYNGGMKHVDDAIAEAKAVGEPELWLSSAHISPEARKYAVDITTRFAAGAGAPKVPTEQEYIDAAVAQLGPKAAPQVIDMTRQRAANTYAVAMHSRDQKIGQTVQDVQRAIAAAGGDFSAVQAQQPQLVAELMAFAPDKVDDMKTFAARISKPATADDMTLYGDLVAHPEKLTQLSDADATTIITTRFKPETQKELFKLRADALDGKKDNGAGAINDSALNTVLNERLEQIGLEWKASKNPADKASYGTVQKFLRDGIFDQQRQVGRKLTPEEISTFVDQQFANQGVLHHWYRPDGTQPELAMRYGDIPSETRSQLEALMPNAPENDRLRAYWIAQRNKRAAAADHDAMMVRARAVMNQ